MIASVNAKHNMCITPPEAMSQLSKVQSLAQHELNGRTIKQIITNQHHSIITPEYICKTFNIGRNTAKRTLQVTMQHGTQNALHPLHR
eukprot:3206297-Ditylum_brightwellii.AAC.2